LIADYTGDEVTAEKTRWAIQQATTWDVAGMFTTRQEAEAEQAKVGTSYEVGYGSRKLGSNDFVFE